MDAILNWIWQGSLIAIASCAVLDVLGRISAAARYWLCWTALLLILLLPLIAGISRSPSAVEPRNAQEASHALTAPVIVLPSTADSPPALAAIWMLWVAILGGRAAVDVVRVHRVSRTCRAFPREREGRLPHWETRRGRRAVRLVVSDGIPAAAVLGVRSPVIAVSPILLDRLSDEELDLVLMHEWAHLERRDEIANALQLLVRVAAGWHPGVWWIDRRLYAEREAACDERTVDRTGSSRAYAACLVRLAELQLPQRNSIPVAAAVSSSHIGDRVVRLINRRQATRGRAALAAAVAAAGLAGLTMAVGPVWLVTAAAPALAIPRLMDSRAEVGLDHFPFVALPAVSPRSNPGSPRPGPQIRKAARLIPERQAFSRLPPAPSPIPRLAGSLEYLPAETTAALTMPASIGAQPGSPPSSEEEAGQQSAAVAGQAGTAGSPSGYLVFADAGGAIGSGSQRAAVRTARFFTNVGRKIAGAF